MKKFLLSLLSLTVLAVCAKTVIMKVEMKDGNVRYIDTEAVDEFNFVELEAIPEAPADNYLTETVWTDAHWYHHSLFTAIDRQVKVTDRYIANNPTDHTFAISGWGVGCRTIKATGTQNGNIVNLEVACQPTGYKHPEYGEIWIADRAHYALEVAGGTPVDDCLSYYDGRNYLQLDVVYYAPRYLDGKTFSQAAVEYIAAADYSPVDMGYRLENSNGKYTARVEASAGLGIVDRIDACVMLGNMNNFYLLKNEVTEKFNAGDRTSCKLQETPNTILSLEPDPENYYLVIGYKAYDSEGTVIGNPDELLWYYIPIDELSGETIIVARGTVRLGLLYSGETETYLNATYTPNGSTIGAEYVLLRDTEYQLRFYTDDIYKRDADNNIKVYMPETSTGLSSGGKEVFIASTEWFCENYGVEGLETAPSYYSPEKGCVQLHNIAYTNSDGLGMISMGYDYFAFDGCDRLWIDAIELSVSGVEPKADGTTDITVSYAVNRNNGSYLKAVACDMNADKAKQYLTEIAGNLAPINCGREGSFVINTNLTGTVSIAAQLHDPSGKVLGVSTSVCLVKRINPSEWTYLGQALFEDGWIIPAFSDGNGPLQAADNTWNVDLYRSTEDPTLYAIDMPWSDKTSCPIASSNESADADLAFVKFNIYDGHVVVKTQYSGFACAGSPVAIGNCEGNLAESNPGVEMQVIYDALTSQGVPHSVFTDNTVVIAEPLVGLGMELQGYWSDQYQAVKIHFPTDASTADSAAKKMPARSVSAASSGIKRSAGILRNRIPSMSPVKLNSAPGNFNR